MEFKKTAKEIHELIGGEIIGDQNFVVSNVSSLEDIKEGSILFIKSKKYIPSFIPQDVLLIVPKKLAPYISFSPKAKIYVDNIEESFLKILTEFYPVSHPIGISETAKIGKNVTFGNNIYIGEWVTIGDNTVVGDNVKLYTGTYIGKNVKIGKNTIIYPYVVILDNVQIGNDCIIQSGTVLGGYGFGYTKLEGIYKRIPQIGGLIIEDRVEIGPLCVIDRGAIENTTIKRGTKIDSLVKIAHNVVIGENSIITAQVGIAGSTKLGKNVMMGGQSGIADHIKVGDNVIIAADAGVISDIPSGSFVSGSPAIDHRQEYKAKAIMYKLPELLKELRKIEKELQSLKKVVLEDE